jgi:hypothetical protein
MGLRERFAKNIQLSLVPGNAKGEFHNGSLK